MQNELSALEKISTWMLTSLPFGKIIVGSKWIYKVNHKPDGSVDRYKALLVAKGYTQVEGEDFLDSYAPVAKIVIVHLFLSFATYKSWPLFHVDINNAFLHGTLDEDVYLDPP